ncbi:MAG: VWA domain-containing protein [Nanoarchaeota archaeon]
MQITFEHPQFLWLLILVPAVIIFHFVFIRYSHINAMRFANFRALKRVTGRGKTTRNLTLLFIRVVALLALILGASGLAVWYSATVDRNDYVIAIDTSASMTAEDFTPNRLEMAKGIVNDFVEALPPDVQVGLLTFSGVTLIQQTMTVDRFVILDSLSGIEVEKAGGTDIPGAIISGANMLQTSEQGRTLIIITDGSSTVGAFTADAIAKAAAYAAEKHVKIYAIGIGSDTGPIGYLPEYYNVSATYNEDTLVQITNATGGIYMRLLDPTADEPFQPLIDGRTRGETRRDLAGLLLLIAILSLFVDWTLSNTIYRQLP